MTCIHERPRWPDFAWSDSLLSMPLATVRHKQGRLLGRMESLGFELRDEANLGAITSDVVKSSAIEGETIDPREARSSIARRLGLPAAGLPRASRAVDGLVEMMLDATQNFDRPLTAGRLSAWHAAMFPTGRSGMTRITIGGWRTDESGPMQVVSGAMGRERVHFEAPEADRLDAEMKRFLAWFNASPSIDLVIRAAVAHFWFVTIHPFDDGNGRIARSIADMALARADGSRQRFYSMSSQIEAERGEYYRRLERTQRGDVDITGWLEWFLACLDRALVAASASLAAVLRKADTWQRINTRPVNDRQRLVVNRLLDGFKGFVTTSKYAQIAKCSADSALRDMGELVERGILVRNPGGGRSTSYRLSEADAIRP